MGTVAYMSPEQAAGKINGSDSATYDIYSLGATLYHILTGRPPLHGYSLEESLLRIQSGSFPAPSELVRSIPKSLDSICRKAMAVRPSERYENSSSLAADIERFLADEPVSAHRDSLHIRVKRWMRKHQTKVAAMVATSLVAALSMATLSGVLDWKNRQLKFANLAESRAKADAEARRIDAEASAQVARNQSQLAIESLELIIRDIEEKLSQTQRSLQLRRSILSRVLSQLDRISSQHISATRVNRNKVLANLAIGDVALRLASSGIDLQSEEAETPISLAKEFS